MTSYSKPHLTYQEQLELLKNRGLIVNNEPFFLKITPLLVILIAKNFIVMRKILSGS